MLVITESIDKEVAKRMVGLVNGGTCGNCAERLVQPALRPTRASSLSHELLMTLNKLLPARPGELDVRRPQKAMI